MGVVTGPYGTADNTYATADQDPTQPGFTGDITLNMDYRADCIPGFQYITRSSPRSFGYTTGYLTGDGIPPNGVPFTSGIEFPAPTFNGQFHLRTDFFPNRLFQWNGNHWVVFEDNVKMTMTNRPTDGLPAANTSTRQTLKGSFINNVNTATIAGQIVPERQALSKILLPKADN